MEQRLFLAGVVLGAFAWFSRRRAKAGAESARAAAVRHAAFLALVGFCGSLVLTAALETRPLFVRAGAAVLPLGHVLYALGLGLALGAFGYWRARRAKAADVRARHHEDMEWADTVFSSALMASLLMMFVLQAFKIPSASMENTLLIGDYLFVNKFLYGARLPFTGARVLPLRAPRRGDVVVFQFPADDPTEAHCGSVQYGKDFIKRLIGEPGDKIEVRGGRVLVNGSPLAAEPYAVYADDSREPASRLPLPPELYQRLWQEHHLDRELPNNQQRDFFGPVTVPPGSYFMMGDNRDRSCDSRYWGPVAEKDVKGAAWFRYWPPSRLGSI